MNNKPENPHAFAFAHSNFNDEWVTSQGMTLRDYFAAKAMQAMIGSIRHGEEKENIGLIPEAAYMMADLMLKEREK